MTREELIEDFAMYKGKQLANVAFQMMQNKMPRKYRKPLIKVFNEFANYGAKYGAEHPEVLEILEILDDTKK